MKKATFSVSCQELGGIRDLIAHADDALAGCLEMNVQPVRPGYMEVALIAATFPTIAITLPLATWVARKWKPIYLFDVVRVSILINLALVAWLLNGDENPGLLALYILNQIVSFGYWSHNDALGYYYRD